MGEYEPNDSRNVTGTAQTSDGRWTGQAKQGQPNQAQQQGGRPTQAGEQQSGQEFDQDVQFDGGSGSQADIAGQMKQSGGAGGQMGGDQGSDQGFAESFTAQEASQSGQQNQSNLGAGQMGEGVQFTPDPQLTQQVGGGQSQQGQPQQQAPEQNMGGSQGEIGQQNDGVSNASNQNNDHTSGIGQEQQFDAQGLSGANQGGGAPSSGVLGQQGGATGTSRFNEQIAQHMEVVDPSGQHLGTVDHIDGDRIKLARKDSPDGQHHYVQLSQVEGIEGGKIRLSSGATSV